MSGEDPVRALLTLCARPRMPIDLLPELARRAARIERWDETVDMAERHGLGPLVHSHFRGQDVFPPGVKLRLHGIYLRNRMVNDIRLRALREILDVLDLHGIEARVLKGPALFSLVYDNPALRPTSDLDILVPRRHALHAQRLLTEMGYQPSSPSSNASFGRHHHLPVTARMMDGVLVQVEIHHDVFSQDYGTSLTLTAGRECPTTISVEGRPALGLGPHEMLWHLCQHLVGPQPQALRLIWIADIVGFAETYSEQLNWKDALKRHVIIANALALTHALTPLPSAVVHHIPRRPLEELRSVAADDRLWAWTPGSSGLATDSRLHQFLRILSPPAWWLGVRYGHGPGPFGLSVQRLRHLIVAGRTLRRRLGPALAQRNVTGMS